MIPQKLSLINFLSYRETSLDFTRLHTACICGANGAGKSSLLEAIGWVIWGNSRVASEDDLIRLGEKEMRVDFSFISHGNLYRVIRSRRRGQSGTLEFQVAVDPPEVINNWDEVKFRVLTERGIRPTQQKILEYLKLDYDTFVNSAYLRQGRADEFMLKRASERKEILATLLKLNEYDGLVEQAKERSKQFKLEVELLQKNLESTQIQLQQKDEIAEKIKQLEENLHQVQTVQTAAQEQLKQLQNQQYQRQTWENLRQGQQQQFQTLSQDDRRLQQELNATQQSLQELMAVLQQQEEINAGYAKFQTLQATEEILSTKFKTYQDTIQRLNQLQELQRQRLNQLQQQIQTVQTQINNLTQQETEYEQILTKRQEVEAGLQELQGARTRLEQLDQLQLQVSPLLQQRQQLQTEIDRIKARYSARLEELLSSVKQLQYRLRNNQPQLQELLQETDRKIVSLDNKKTHQRWVLEKGTECRNNLDNLNSRQKEYESQLIELDQKIALLNTSSQGEEQPLCPLCNHSLDEHHHNLVVNKHRQQQEEIRNKIWVIQEQITVSNQEVEGLREQYSQLKRELAPYESLREQRGQTQAKLDRLAEEELQLQKINLEVKEIERALQSGQYAVELYPQLQALDVQLQQLNYHDQDHALARNEEKRWRWAEIQQSKLQDAQNKLTRIQQQKPDLEQQLNRLKQEFNQQQTDSEFQQQIIALDQKLQEIGYRLEEHNQVRIELRQAQQWLTRLEKLNQAEKQSPQLQQRLEELQQLKQQKAENIRDIQGQIGLLDEQLKNTPDLNEIITQIEQQIKQRRQQLDEAISQLGSLKQQQSYLAEIEQQLTEQTEEINQVRRQYRVYQELAQAFGKNGIQALMIENILPQLEAETNHLLARLSANQLHVQFVTQRVGKSSRSSKKKPAKLIDTLDILIADSQGTRAYETYSGGEAFRINFAIRLALSRLLAQRAGAALQLLIIDEGFGTQDAEGCERLIAAINAISADFACILTVTHMPHLKEAFQARIEVEKTPQGSQVKLLM
ncbi:MAG: exonuclease subunit SbcC [Microcoleaceae cyanobacterium]